MLLLHEFNFEVKDRKGTKNQVADHLSRLEDEALRELFEKAENDDAFPDERILAVWQDEIAWFVIDRIIWEVI